MRNPFVILGLITIGVGVFCLSMAFGLLGHDIHLQAISGLVALISIVMGLILIQLMKDDSLYQKESIK